MIMDLGHAALFKAIICGEKDLWKPCMTIKTKIIAFQWKRFKRKRGPNTEPCSTPYLGYSVWVFMSAALCLQTEVNWCFFHFRGDGAERRNSGTE